MSTSGTYQVHQCAAQLKPQKLVRDGFAQNESNGNVNVKPTQRLLRAVLHKFQLSSFGRGKMKFLKLSQMNGLDK